MIIDLKLIQRTKFFSYTIESNWNLNCINSIFRIPFKKIQILQYIHNNTLVESDVTG